MPGTGGIGETAGEGTGGEPTGGPSSLGGGTPGTGPGPGAVSDAVASPGGYDEPAAAPAESEKSGGKSGVSGLGSAMTGGFATPADLSPAVTPGAVTDIGAQQSLSTQGSPGGFTGAASPSDQAAAQAAAAAASVYGGGFPGNTTGLEGFNNAVDPGPGPG